MAEKKNDGTVQAAQAPETTTEKQETVKIKLFKDNGRYKGDVYVSVNGRRYQIQRGVEVEVPAEVAEVLEHSQRQDNLAASRIAQAEAEAMTGGK